ncbi:MAG: zinc ribbon domain-containing protein [Candidatus Aenigmatarchaeota archaeon]|nr:MAG: zinc ribbon domain-containing protein [Candidatus Aenigmarchaeota archaeon]
MKCPRCGSDVNEGWKFCPKCGSGLERKRDLFGGVFERMERELKGMDRAFERDFQVFDLSPFFKKPVKSSGFSIKISRSGREKPKVSVKTFGDIDRKEVNEEVGKLGFRGIPKPERQEVKGEGICLEAAKTTEEPEMCVRRIGDRIVVEVKLPEVRDPKDIEVVSLENSIEVKAIAGDKAYFRILTKPPKTNIVRKDFEDGVLRIELV